MARSTAASAHGAFAVFPSLPLPDIVINSDDYNRVSLLAEGVLDLVPVNATAH